MPHDLHGRNNRHPQGSPAGQAPSPLATAISTTLEAVQTSDSPPVRVSQDKEKARREERAAHRKAKETARGVFADHETHPDPGRTSGPTAITGSRPPQPSGADRGPPPRPPPARRRAPRTRHHSDHITNTARPPAHARRHHRPRPTRRRSHPTAEPFTRTIRRRVPTPPLRLGIACDVSGSMRTLAAPVASAAWILARAASHVPDANSATVIFGSRVRPVIHPGHTPTRVKEFTARDKTEQFCDAIDALDAALDLTRPNVARLLIIVSDGRFTPLQRVNGQHRINRLAKNGCAILWLALDNRMRPMPGTHRITLSEPAEPAEAAAMIGQAATKALRHA